jgi:cytochrome P450
MLHDEYFFPRPTEFNPERFLKDNILREDLPDPEKVATFGFGRRHVNIRTQTTLDTHNISIRMCPGAHIALSALHIMAASILHLFDISPALDSAGNPIEVKPQFPEANFVS